MGLKSLPLLNKSGISMYWSNVWDSIKLYKKYSFNFFYLHDVIYFFLNENMYYHCIMKIRRLGLEFKGTKIFKPIDTDKIKKAWNMRHLFLGKIFFLKSQDWVIVVVSYYTSKRVKLYINLKTFKGFKKLIKKYRTNSFNHKYQISKYKFKF